jgi:hypothetical protein
MVIIHSGQVEDGERCCPAIERCRPIVREEGVNGRDIQRGIDNAQL